MVNNIGIYQLKWIFYDYAKLERSRSTLRKDTIVLQNNKPYVNISLYFHPYYDIFKHKPKIDAEEKIHVYIIVRNRNYYKYFLDQEEARNEYLKLKKNEDGYTFDIKEHDLKFTNIFSKAIKSNMFYINVFDMLIDILGLKQYEDNIKTVRNVTDQLDDKDFNICKNIIISIIETLVNNQYNLICNFKITTDIFYTENLDEIRNVLIELYEYFKNTIQESYNELL